MVDHRDRLLKNLSTYYAYWFDERKNPFHEDPEILSRFEALLQNDLCASRELLTGHLTGAACITDTTFARVLLTHHKKLNRWLQLGGHADGDLQMDRVALKEGEEESGLTNLKFASPDIFDLDIHQIPARPNEPEHFHYDVRYLLIAEDPDAIVISDESNDLRWFSLSEAYASTSEASMHRQFKKLEAFASTSSR